MNLLAMAALVLAVVAIRELVRGRGRPRLRTMFDFANQPIGVTLAGLGAMYLAVAALAFTAVAIYGRPTGSAHFGVGEVLADGAAVGKLERGDRIETFDGEPLVIGIGRTLTERVNDKQGAAFDLAIVRDGVRHVVRIEPKQGTDKQNKTLWMIGIRPTIDQDRTRDGAVSFGLGYPAHHVVQLVRDIAHWVRGSAEVSSVMRIVERVNVEPTGLTIFLGALRLAGHLFVLFTLIDLIRLAIAIRDRLRT